MLQIITVVLMIVAGLFFYIFEMQGPTKTKDALDYVGQDVKINSTLTQNQNVPIDAMAAYHSAQSALAKDDLKLAELLFKKAVSVHPDFTEAWNDLGATQLKLATQFMKDGDESKSLEYFERGTENKKKAYAFMKRGVWFDYNDERRAQVLNETAKEITEADKALADRPSLISKLKASAP